MSREHRQRSKATLITLQHSCFLHNAESSCSEGGSRLFHRAKWNTGPNKRPLGPRTAGLRVSAWLFRQARLIREAEKCQRATKLVEELDLTHQQNLLEGSAGEMSANKATQRCFTLFLLCASWRIKEETGNKSLQRCEETRAQEQIPERNAAIIHPSLGSNCAP